MTRTQILLFVLLLFIFTNCKTEIKVKEQDKIFHAGPLNSSIAAKFFGLYKDNKYEFCDGNFIDPGCYTGFYDLLGDTIILKGLHKHQGIPTNKFLIRRYNNMDSSYWIWKYPKHAIDWKIERQQDLSDNATGDVFPLDEMNKIESGRNDHFLIQLDSLKNSR